MRKVLLCSILVIFLGAAPSQAQLLFDATVLSNANTLIPGGIYEPYSVGFTQNGDLFGSLASTSSHYRGFTIRQGQEGPEPRVYAPISTFSGANLVIHGMNESGRVIGVEDIGVTRAIVASATTGAVSYLPGWEQGSIALGINTAGYIIGEATQRATLWGPNNQILWQSTIWGSQGHGLNNSNFGAVSNRAFTSVGVDLMDFNQTPPAVIQHFSALPPGAADNATLVAMGITETNVIFGNADGSATGPQGQPMRISRGVLLLPNGATRVLTCAAVNGVEWAAFTTDVIIKGGTFYVAGTCMEPTAAATYAALWTLQRGQLTGRLPIPPAQKTWDLTNPGSGATTFRMGFGGRLINGKLRLGVNAMTPSGPRAAVLSEQVSP